MNTPSLSVHITDPTVTIPTHHRLVSDPHTADALISATPLSGLRRGQLVIYTDPALGLEPAVDHSGLAVPYGERTVIFASSEIAQVLIELLFPAHPHSVALEHLPAFRAAYAAFVRAQQELDTLITRSPSAF